MCRRGYADQEIHSLFVNHNLNGDGVLDKGEAKRMLSELQGLSVSIGRHHAG